MKLFIYVLTLSLQLSGSILLLFSSFGNIRVKVINDCVGGSFMLLSKNKIVNLGEKEVKSSLCSVYMNRASFLALIIGYLLSIFNSYQVEKATAVLCITIIAVVLISVLLFFIAETVAKINAKKYCQVPIDKLPNGTTILEEY
jgi:hypothetical protein